MNNLKSKIHRCREILAYVVKEANEQNLYWIADTLYEASETLDEIDSNIDEFKNNFSDSSVLNRRSLTNGQAIRLFKEQIFRLVSKL